ncbi:MAG TPA: hypothetical protein VD884_13200 [Ohtaekwangia sp.]|nr:hypothetical protein [Ohtaekwangia sp.]
MIVLTTRRPEIVSRIKTPGSYTLTTLLPLFKKHLKWEASDTSEDDLMGLYLTSAIKQAETYTRRAIDVATWETFLDSFYDFDFDVAPVSAITSVKYYNDANVLTTLDPLNYTFINKGPDAYARLEFESGLPALYDRHEPVVIEYTAGYVTYPNDLVGPILQYAADLFENRTNDVAGGLDQVTFGFHQRLFSYKML